MKASLKFREDQRPLARAKIPISILGLPFLAGAGAGQPRELRLDLSTAFDSGPAFRVSYRPNDYGNPFSFAVKTGIGAFGSPVAAPMSMTTEFNLLGSRGSAGGPGFSVVFKPRLGDFCFRKSASSSSSPIVSRKVASADRDVDCEEMASRSPSAVPIVNGKAYSFAVDFPAAREGFDGLFSGVGVTASTVLPMRNRTAVKFRWGVQVPPELRSSLSNDRFSVTKLPMLVLSKISIEHSPAPARAKLTEKIGRSSPAGEAEEAFESVRRELDAVQAESRALRKAVEDLREKITDVRMYPAAGNKNNASHEPSKGASPETIKRERRNDAKPPAAEVAVKPTTGDVNEELRKALLSATGN